MATQENARLGEQPGMVRVECLFRGHVQGVGFRATSRAIALSHGLTGWVMNQADGSVLLQAQGQPNAVQAFLADLRETMRRRIESESVMPVGAVGEERSFEVRR